MVKSKKNDQPEKLRGEFEEAPHLEMDMPHYISVLFEIRLRLRLPVSKLTHENKKK